MNEITALIRFKNSEKTLPDVLAALASQTRPPKKIVAVDTGSTDDSARLLHAAGARIVTWEEDYHASKVLNFGLRHCETPFVLCLSSHTVAEEHDTVARLANLLEEDPVVCAASIKWDEDPHHSDCIDWQEMTTRGMKFGSIYSNSLGLMRHRNWQAYPFDETMNGMEDYDWALHQLREGYKVCRITAQIRYQRSGHNRDFRATARASRIANRYGLRLVWLGVGGAIQGMVTHLPGHLKGDEEATRVFNVCRRRLGGRLLWRFIDVQNH